jgi:hypothetical protein
MPSRDKHSSKLLIAFLLAVEWLFWELELGPAAISPGLSYDSYPGGLNLPLSASAFFWTCDWASRSQSVREFEEKES